jgi:hypothetical protein
LAHDSAFVGIGTIASHHGRAQDAVAGFLDTVPETIAKGEYAVVVGIVEATT